jgi:quercetin dioxygenase-like cupin family protein
MHRDDVVRTIAEPPTHAQQMSWGSLTWLVNSALMPGAQQTFGVVTIAPGKANPLHLHPNCEELLYVLSGECHHTLGDEVFHLTPGTVIRIPQGTSHQARCISQQPLMVVVSFSSPDRQTVNINEGGEIA